MMSHSGLPLAGKFPCKRKFWPVQGKGQGNQIYQEMARKFEPGQGNCEEILKIVRLRAIPLENRGTAALTNCRACLIKLRLLVYISKQGQKHLLKGAVSNDSIRLG
jgi:hypothetical protein